MKPRLGTYITQKIGGETYKAFVPPKLHPKPPIDLALLFPLLEKATAALAGLNSIHQTIPNTALFLYMNIRKEALLSSQIEGTQSSFSDLMLFEHHLKPTVSLEDVEEVSYYVKAIHYGLKRLKNFPLSLRLLREIHAILLKGGRGAAKQPGEFRRSQNWIGGTRPGNALFVPPPVDHLNECLSDFERFLHDESLPVLIKTGIAHVQFETIHPFLDGNGRLGRLLITLMLCQSDLLHAPILYLSLFLKQNRSTYYDLLQEVRLHGKWEPWLEFFLEGITKSAQQAKKTALKINALFDQDLRKIDTLGRAKHTCQRIFTFLQKLPQVNVPLIAKELNITAPTSRAALNHMIKVGILKEISKKQRNKVYVYREYLKILETGAKPL